jgi:hypothetical protein
MDTEDAKEGIRSFVERREAKFQGRQARHAMEHA